MQGFHPVSSRKGVYRVEEWMWLLYENSARGSRECQLSCHSLTKSHMYCSSSWLTLLSLSISLRVVDCGQGYFNTQESKQLLHECSDKLWTSIGDHLSWEAMEFSDVSKVQVGRSSSCDGSDHFDKVGPLTD